MVAGMLATFVLSLALVAIEKTINKFDLIVWLFLLLIGSASLLNGTDWKNWLYISSSIVAYTILFHFYHDYYKALIYTATLVFSVGIYLQLLQCILHPELWIIREEKVNTTYLLGGNYNQIGARTLIAFTLGIMSVHYNKRWLINFVPLLIAGLTIQCMVQSMTSLGCIILFLLLMLIRNKRLLRIGIVGIFSGWAFFQIVVCFRGSGLENNELAVWFIEDVLHKDITFTYRTYMWDAALRVIGQSPIWGYGLVGKEWFYSNMSTIAIGAHNFILNTMVYGGILSMILYGILIFLCFRNLRNYNSMSSLRLKTSFGILCIMMLFEAYEIPIVLFLLCVMYHYQEFGEKTSKHEKTE